MLHSRRLQAGFAAAVLALAPRQWSKCSSLPSGDVCTERDVCAAFAPICRHASAHSSTYECAGATRTRKVDREGMAKSPGRGGGVVWGVVGWGGLGVGWGGATSARCILVDAEGF